MKSVEAILHSNAPARRLAAAWFALALLALALSTLCAVLLVLGRAPLPVSLAVLGALFRSALVLHVGLAVVVWFLACAAALWTLAAGEGGVTRWLAWSMSAAGLVAMVLALFVGTPAPVLANYVPVLDSSVYLAGLCWFVAGVVLCGVLSWLSAWRNAANEVWRWGALASMLAAGIALAALLLVLTDGSASTHGYETLLWAPGHLLQFVHVLIMMTIWSVLGRETLGRPVLYARTLLGLLLATLLPMLAMPLIHASYALESVDFRQAYTTLMSWGSWPAAAALAVVLLARLAHAGRATLLGAQGLPLALSALLFLLGCLFGALIRSESTMVPAHYHGTVGAVTLAYMTLAYRLLPTSRLTTNSRARWQLAVYGTGLLVLATALAWSGSLGVPRKTAHSDILSQPPSYLLAMGLVGLGGALAIGGAAWFVFNVVQRFRRPPQHAGNASARSSHASAHPDGRADIRADMRGDIRKRALLFTVVAVALGGLALAWLPDWAGSVTARADAEARSKHAREATLREIDQRFQQGVVMLHARQYDHALMAFHRVLTLSPEMPEAHVNAGFALLGMGKPAAARDFFESATLLRREQVNAYYGLAVALEALKDVPGALGAMRAYLHLAPQDDPYRRKAMAAVWEWETRLGRAAGELPSVNMQRAESMPPDILSKQAASEAQVAPGTTTTPTTEARP